MTKLSTRIGIPLGKSSIGDKIDKIVKYFKKRSFKSDEDTLRDLCCGDQDMMNHLRKEIEEYRVDRLIDSSRVLLESLEHPKSMKEIGNRDNRTTTSAFLSDMLRFGYFRGQILDIYNYRYHFVDLQIECIDRRATSYFSSDIREHLYSILLRGATDEASNRGVVEMKEFQRKGQKYVSQTIAITPCSQTLFQLLDQSSDARRLFILQNIELADQSKSVEEISKTLNSSMLFLLALKYFVQICVVPPYQVEAFLLMHIFCKRKVTTVLSNEPPFLDFPLLHQFNSFQSVLYYLSMLNTLLGNAFDETSARNLLSGSKFLHINQRLLRGNFFNFYFFIFFYSMKYLKDSLGSRNSTAMECKIIT